MVTSICYPDIGSIECHAPGIPANRKGAKQCAVTGSQLCQCVLAKIGYPNVAPVKDNPLWLKPSGESPQQGTIAGSEFSYSVAVQVCRPDIGSIKGEVEGIFSYRKGLDPSFYPLCYGRVRE